MMDFIPFSIVIITFHKSKDGKKEFRVTYAKGLLFGYVHFYIICVIFRSLI